MHYRHFDDFAAKAQLLVQSSAATAPKTLCTIAFAPKQHTARVRVTNSAQALHWHTSSVDDVRRLLTFTRSAMESLQNRKSRLTKPQPSSKSQASLSAASKKKKKKGGK